MTDLDYYLTCDHAARRSTTLLSVAAGTGVGMLSQELGASLKVAAGLCVLSIGCIEIVRAWRYAQPTPKKRQAADLPSPARRRFLIVAPVSAILFLMMAFLPIPLIEAAVVERRLRRMTDETSPPLEKVSALLVSAMQNGIPISEKSIDAAQYKILRAAAQSTSSPTRPSPTPATATFAQLEAYRLYSVAGVRLYIYDSILLPAQLFPFDGPVYGHFVSTLGLSRTATVLDVTFKRTEANVAALNYTYDPRVTDDVLVGRMTATGQSLVLSEAPEFIHRAPARNESRKVVVSNATISNLHQTLDGLLWIDVEFDHCLITYQGGSIYMDRVSFHDCEFSVPNQADAEVADYVRAQGTKPVTLKRAGRD
jgi:hypothetical protein